MRADVVFLDANVLTMSSMTPLAQAVAISDGIISGVGNTSDIENLIGPGTRIINCHGQSLTPGFHDAHIHLLPCASHLLGVDCGPGVAASIADIQQAIRRRVEITPNGEWIRAGNYDEFLLVERRHPTRWDLDAVSPDHPVKLRHRSHHACVLNSLALKLAGIDAGFIPPAGAQIEYDAATGEPNGFVYELEPYLTTHVVPPWRDAELRAALNDVFDDLISKGITAIQDAGSLNGPKEWTLFQELGDDGRIRPKLSLMIGQPYLAEITRMGLGFGSIAVRPDSGAGQRNSCGVSGSRLRVGPVKIMLTEARDDFNPTAEDLFEQVWAAHTMGFPVAIHAVEETAVCLAIEAIAMALDRLPRGAHRHRLEHASVLPSALLDRIAELGIGVATQPGFLYHSGDRYLVDVDEHLRQWLYPLKSIVDSGVIVAAGSDAPVVPANPLMGIYSALSRCSRQGKVVNAAERITVEEALRMHTINPALLLGQEQEIGSIEVGKRADLVLLGADLLRAPVEEVKDIRVEMTMIDGSVVWER